MDPALLSRRVRAVTTRRVRTISRKDLVQAAAVSDDYLFTANGLLQIVDVAYAMNSKARRVPRGAIQAAIEGRGILTGHTPDSHS